jgi:uncharacterized membrane protein YecN with MAPEG domain
MKILTEMTHAEACSLWSGLLILLLGLLAIRVNLVRTKYEEDSENGEVSQLTLARRIFANGAEYIPVSIGALILFYHLELPVAAIHAFGATLLAGRVIQALGLNKAESVSISMAGMVLTFTSIFVGGGMLVVYAFL